MLDAVIEQGRYKGKTVMTALQYQHSKLKSILDAVEDIGGSAPHLVRELYEVETALRILSEIYAPNYSI